MGARGMGPMDGATTARGRSCCNPPDADGRIVIAAAGRCSLGEVMPAIHVLGFRRGLESLLAQRALEPPIKFHRRQPHRHAVVIRRHPQARHPS